MLRASLTDRLIGLFAIAIAASLLFIGLRSYGIWDPWEIDFAERALPTAAEVVDHGGRAQERRSLDVRLVGWSLEAFGTTEGAGRLIPAIGGLLCALLALIWVTRARDLRAGAYAGIIAVSQPLTLFHSRTMIGESLGMALAALVGISAHAALFPGRKRDGRTTMTGREAVRIGALLLLCAGATVASIQTSGLLRGPLPPLLAVAAVIALDGGLLRRPFTARSIAAVALLGAGLLALGLSTWAVWADAAHANAFTGAAPAGDEPGSFERVLGHVAHAFAPYSALALLGLGAALLPRSDQGPAPAEEQALGVMASVWIAASYGATVVVDARYGGGAFLAVVPLAAVVAIYLRDVELGDEPSPMGAVVITLFAALIFRDYALYPESPLSALNAESLRLPTNLETRRDWALLLSGFVAVAVLGLFSRPEPARPRFSAPYRILLERFRAGKGFKAWVLLLVSLWLFCLGFGLTVWIAHGSARGDAAAAGAGAAEALGISQLTVNVGRLLPFVAIGLPVGIALLQGATFLFGKLGRARMLPVVAAGAVFAAYTGHGLLPKIGNQLSSREVFDTYNALRGDDAELMLFRVPGRSADYYVEGPVQRTAVFTALAEYLHDPEERRWAMLPADQLAHVDNLYRERSGEHLVIVDDENPRALLATNRPYEGRENRNLMVQAVRREPPESIEHPTAIHFGKGVQLLGYDLELPHEGYVGAGERFAITWYFKATEELAQPWRIFLHIDGSGGRINGDHDPVDGRYPVRFWQPGDIVVDRQELRVPASFTEGEYTLFMGFWNGPTRLPVVAGDQDGENRAIAGTLRIR